MAKIVVTDGMSNDAVNLLKKNGHEVTLQSFSKDELLNGCLSKFDAIIVRSATKLTKEVIESTGSKLKVIGRAGVGVDNIDLDAASNAKITVVNAPLASTQSVVELTIAHLLSSIRHLSKSDRGLRLGKWEKKAMVGTELSGKSLGLIGFGRIAQGVGMVAQAMGMEVHTYDPYLPPKVAKNQSTRLHKDVDTLFKSCTHISVHCNLTDETHHLVNYERMKLMPGKSRLGLKCGNHIVNCARGGIVDEEGLFQALEEGIISSAALDVFEQEPVDSENKLLSHPDFHGTPHIGAATIEAQSRVGLDIAKNVMDSLAGKTVKAIVNSHLMK
ncbi:MAG: hydroxyacid dehydrogenase [Candidatus Poseidoniaceae archaeon]|nr:phosphoglycerate dehydrogenase [Euryarchaeota archaeon]MBL6890773.1 hydroxyacid dehydrogenase [Candidatus Poseidoniaceae archaeon]RAH07683.1 MAG: phosphoglycerate dehydrogenase [Euryarchaeota archaeon TMED132]|tara:strand:- start:375 stop:1361 length:987 start_codon:yes stop_codon:yes gene_type:complete